MRSLYFLVYFCCIFSTCFSSKDGERSSNTALPSEFVDRLIEPELIYTNMSFRWVPYCEILASRNRISIWEATSLTAYNTLLGGCPEDKWATITEKTIRDKDGSWAVKLNGPRGWAFDTVSKNSTLVDREITVINGIDMVVVGLVQVSFMELLRGLMGGMNIYNPRDVLRRSIYIFYAGSPIFFLESPTKETYVMQSYGQMYFNVTKDNLPTLGTKFEKMPAGWTYNYVESLSLDLPLKAINDVGVIVNDEFLDVYSQCDRQLLHRAIGKGNKVVVQTFHLPPVHMEL